jgi:hypothetical protein
VDKIGSGNPETSSAILLAQDRRRFPDCHGITAPAAHDLNAVRKNPHDRISSRRQDGQ